MEELLELLLDEIEEEREFYGRAGTPPFDIEPRVLNVLAMVLIKAKGRLQIQNLESREG